VSDTQREMWLPSINSFTQIIAEMSIC